MNREDIEYLVNGCDAGREGELIFQRVYDLSGCRKPVRRLWISSMEDEAIKNGFREMKDAAFTGIFAWRRYAGHRQTG